ncbi:DUF6924 domain-containing protein [Streptomyces paradoxus]|uniref:DUF6924 domain-containing protein n=1 Tax=Streptomyces paradoxus TaxID=66375 RepID=UPI0037CE6ADA
MSAGRERLPAPADAERRHRTSGAAPGPPRTPWTRTPGPDRVRVLRGDRRRPAPRSRGCGGPRASSSRASGCRADAYPCATRVSDPRFAGAGMQALPAEGPAAGEDERIGEVFLADATAPAGPEHPLPAVDLFTEPGRSFRVPVRRSPQARSGASGATEDQLPSSARRSAVSEPGSAV